MTNQNFETPKKIFNFAQKYFNLKFDLDVCATKENTLCKNYFTKNDNSLKRDWINKPPLYFFTLPYNIKQRVNPIIWLNPPYNQASEFIKKATEQNKKHNIEIVGLFNVISDTKAFHECLYDYNCKFVDCDIKNCQHINKKQKLKENIEFYLIPKRITFNLNGLKTKYPNPKPSMFIHWKINEMTDIFSGAGLSGLALGVLNSSPSVWK
tara:strand:- start:640 stop:1266 length:627 start_codon:yes stop_codon:yes gene_type:complete